MPAPAPGWKCSTSHFASGRACASPSKPICGVPGDERARRVLSADRVHRIWPDRGLRSARSMEETRRKTGVPGGLHSRRGGVRAHPNARLSYSSHGLPFREGARRGSGNEDSVREREPVRRALLRWSLPEAVLAVLAEAALPQRSLKLEVTETALMENAEMAASVMRALSDDGVRFGLDDFGTGYSSLSHLRSIPLRDPQDRFEASSTRSASIRTDPSLPKPSFSSLAAWGSSSLPKAWKRRRNSSSSGRAAATTHRVSVLAGPSGR